MRLLSSLLVLMTTIFASTSASASNCAMNEYNHNGSVMEAIICDGGALNISYIQPRKGIAAQGARSGTLLFNGVEQGGGHIRGTARLFSRRCGVITYQVSGKRKRNGNIVLTGQAPRRNKSCRVVSYRRDRLAFHLIGGGGHAGPSHPPASSGGDWHAIAGSFPTRNGALNRRSALAGIGTL